MFCTTIMDWYEFRGYGFVRSRTQDLNDEGIWFIVI